jgi:hypothetical protein
VHAPKLIKEYYARKKSAVRAINIKGDDQLSTDAPPSLSINRITMSNGSLSPASTFSFIYPTMDCEETPTARTTNDHQYDDQVVLFGADGRQSIGIDPSLADFDPLSVDITLCDTWYQPEAVYCNDTWWATLQDDGSEASELGSSNVPSRPHAPVNWAGPESPFFVPTRDAYPPDPRDAIESTIPSTPPHTPPPIGLTSTTTTDLPTTSTIPTTTTCTHAATNNGGHVDHAVRTCDEARHHNCTRDGYTRTATGSYHRGVSTTFINDAPIGRVTKKRHNKNALNCRWGQGQRGFYCGKCQEDGADHVYEECPKWRDCVLCHSEGHYTYMCPRPHYRCTSSFCYVDDGHRNLGRRCPKSGFLHYGQLDYAYDYDGVDHYEGVSQWAENDAENPRE